ncbi:hypothetical protein DYU11_19905 [Fibrisoma montanum]|uniref:HIRAN domain-containing protein n=1 Tax=Fibrisoma montanum TaxID=2305895 RepID=A0A418M3I1_9BACT|nr:HIRAN domain-containing protein [Fibrisoma montanum]RIV20318.1 hypothetical protein DYU11_19905 [Fibrisoma montanum]
MQPIRTYIAATDKYDGQYLLPALPENTLLRLIREPTNQFDTNAIKIYYKKNQLGYVPASVSAQIADSFDNGTAFRATLLQVRQEGKTYYADILITMDEQQLSQLERLVKLKQEGAITEAEFEQQKATILNTGSATESKPKEVKPVGKGCAFLLLVGLGLFILYSLTVPPSDDSDSVSTVRPRSEVVEGFFSPWDGSHPGLERAIKSSMNDPDSYEHVSTRFKDNGSTVYVFTTFRGKNAFGGKVVNYAEGTVNGETGALIDWKFVKD